MPIPSGLHRIQYRFNWNGDGVANEIQETGFWCTVASPTESADATCNIVAQRAVEQWTANMPLTAFSGAVSAAEVNVYNYPAPPPAHAANAGRSSFDAHPWSGSGPQGMPPENTIVATTQAYAPGAFVPFRGRRQRGRMYLPTLTTNLLASTGRVTSAGALSLMNGVIGLLNGIQSEDGSDVVVQPRVLSLVDDEARVITYVRVGDVVDTQRRRRNKLDEVYKVGPTDPIGS